MTKIKIKKTLEISDNKVLTRYSIFLPEYKQPIIIAREEYIDQIIEQLNLLKQIKTQ